MDRMSVPLDDDKIEFDRLWQIWRAEECKQALERILGPATRRMLIGGSVRGVFVGKKPGLLYENSLDVAAGEWTHSDGYRYRFEVKPCWRWDLADNTEDSLVMWEKIERWH
jgi:hypothetical protein